MSDLRFRVVGIPGAQGSKKAFVTKLGKAVVVENSKKVAPWRAAVAEAAAKAMAEDGRTELFEGPLQVTMHFALPGPKSRPRWKQWVDKAPDLSKLVRSTEDALTAVVYRDDRQIVILNATKSYGEYAGHPPGVLILIDPVKEPKPEKLPRKAPS